MCIALISTAHPDYPFILLSNRDEFVNRPTARADWWDAPHAQVLGGRDLQRPAKGTWLGITKQGRVAVLTNFREDGVEVAAEKSRGAIPNAFLTLPTESTETPEEFAKRLIEEVGVHDVGGFSLAFGHLTKPHAGLAILSNRTPSADHLPWIATKSGEVHGLSNSHYGDLSWPKVVHGEQLLKQAIHSSSQRSDSKEELLERCFEILSIDTLPRHKAGEDWQTYTRQLRNSIFVPAFGGDDVAAQRGDEVAAADGKSEPVKVGGGVYGTQKQTVMLVDKHGKVTFRERTLYNGESTPVGKQDGERTFEFQIEGWEG